MEKCKRLVTNIFGPDSSSAPKQDAIIALVMVVTVVLQLAIKEIQPKHFTAGFESVFQIQRKWIQI
jgi:hypothetical protein